MGRPQDVNSVALCPPLQPNATELFDPAIGSSRVADGQNSRPQTGLPFFVGSPIAAKPAPRPTTCEATRQRLEERRPWLGAPFLMAFP